MATQTGLQPCFNCNRSENEIPIIAWRYQGQALWICSECMPNLIHKWHLLAAKMTDTAGDPPQGDEA